MIMKAQQSQAAAAAVAAVVAAEASSAVARKSHVPSCAGGCSSPHVHDAAALALRDNAAAYQLVAGSRTLSNKKVRRNK